MASNDGSVEVRIVGTVDPSVAASAKAASGSIERVGVSAQSMAAALKAAGGDLSKITPAMLGLGAANTGAAVAEGELAVASEGATGAIAEETIATAANTRAVVSNRAATESLVIVHELLQGRTSRLAGSSMILAQALGIGASAGTFLALGAVAAAAGIGYLIYQEMEAENQAQALAEAFTLTGRGAEVTAEGIAAEIDQLSSLPGVSRAAARELIEFDATHAKVSEALSNAVNQLIPAYAEAFGKKAPEAVNKLKESLADLQGGTLDQAIRKFDELNATTLNLAPAQGEVIRQMILMGDTTGAVNQIIADLAAEAGIHIQSVGDQVAATNQKLIEAKNYLDALREAGPGAFDPSVPEAYAEAVAGAAQEVAALQGQLAQLRASADNAQFNESVATSDAILQSLRSSAVRAKDAVAQLHTQMNERLAKTPLDPTVLDYFAHQAKYDKALEHKEDPGDFKMHAPKHHGPSIVSEWAEQLHAQEVQSKDYFADQTKDELDFWSAKLALTTKGSKEWLEVQSHIFEANKTLAHQDYDEHIADLNDKLEADKDSWAKEQADWQEKLHFIAATFTEQSKAYKDAHREFEAAEREHQAQMRQIEREGERAALEDLKNNLKSQETLLQDRAKTAESVITSQARTSANPLAGVHAAQQVAAIEQDLIRQKMALEAEAYQVGDLDRAQSVANVLAAGGAESAAYKKAVQDKEAADQQWAQKKKQLLQQSTDQEIQSAQKIRQAWHSVIDPMVTTTGNQVKGLIEGTETWGQALRNIGEEALNMVIQAIERMVENWIVGMVTGQAEQKTAAVSQVASYAGVAGAAGVASWAGAPWPIDTGAPAFGAAMAAAAMSFASFDKGVNVLPRDMIAQVHAGERIIPAADNRALIAATEGRGGRGGGTINNHYSPTIHAHEPPNLKQMLEQNGSDMIAFMQKAVRNRSFAFA